jgi:hypothetical protein
VATLAGIEGKGRVTLLRRGGVLVYVGSLELDIAHYGRAGELLKSDEPVKYIGPAHTKTGTKDATLNVRVTKVHTPSIARVRVDFVSTGAPESEGSAPPRNR